MAPATAVVAVLTGAAVFGLSQIGGGSTSSSSALSGAGAAQPAIGAALGKAAASAKHRDQQSMAQGSSSGAPAPFSAAAAPSAPAEVRLTMSGIDFTQAALSRQVSAELSRLSALRSEPASAQVTDCVLAVTSGDQPTLVEQARYAGKPAIVIVVLRQATYHVWVTAAGCSAGTPDLLAQTDVPDPVPGTSKP